MKSIKEFIAWLKAIFIKPVAQAADPITPEVKTVSEPIVDVAAPAVVEQPVVVAEPAPAVFGVDVFAAKLKSILILAGHDVEAVYAEAVALAKKL